MTVRDIIRERLAQLGADALCNPDDQCGCGIDDLAPCIEGPRMDCVPARIATVPPVDEWGPDDAYPVGEGQEYAAPLELAENGGTKDAPRAETHFRDEHNAD